MRGWGDSESASENILIQVWFQLSAAPCYEEEGPLMIQLLLQNLA